jgi:hypothetical protein
MLYRAGYSYKDLRQSRILAITMTHEAFTGLLRKAVLSHGPGPEIHNASTEIDPNDSGKKAKSEGREKPVRVRVQWDPERTVRLEKLGYRSIQIGVPGPLVPEWVKGITNIEDVTDQARELKRLLDEDSKIGLEDLVNRGLVPLERAFEVDDELQQILGMGREQ